MLIACVKQGAKYGAEYVTNLKAGVERYLPTGDHRFVCYTDNPVDGVGCEPLPADLPGWWAKVGLFKLRQPLLYFDLDVVITGDLTRAIEWEGFGILNDWWLPTYNSSVMKLTGNEGFIWDEFNPDERAKWHMGDQHYVTEKMPDAKTFPPEWFPSFKANKCFQGPPDNAMAVIMHGEPKPHQLGGWVQEQWANSRSTLNQEQ